MVLLKPVLQPEKCFGRRGGGSATIPIEGFPVGFAGSGHSNTESWAEVRKEACSLSQGNFKYASKFSEYATKVSPVLVKAWQECMDRGGVHASLKITNKTEFTIAIQSSVYPITIAGIEVIEGGIKCKPPLTTFRNKIESAADSVVCRRKDVTKSFTVLPRIKGVPTALPPLTVVGYSPTPKPSHLNAYAAYFHGNDDPTKVTFTVFCVPQASEEASFDTSIIAPEGLLLGTVGLKPGDQDGQFTFHFSHLTTGGTSTSADGHLNVTPDGGLHGRFGTQPDGEYELIGKRLDNQPNACEVRRR